MKKLITFNNSICVLNEASSYNLERKYSQFNKKYFGGKLPQNIDISWGKLGKGVGATASSNHKEGLFKIVMNVKGKDSPEIALDTMLVHEMIHILLPKEGHRSKFKAEAKRIMNINPKLKLVHNEKVTVLDPSVYYGSLKNDVVDIIPVYVGLYYYMPDQKATVGQISDIQFYTNREDIDKIVENRLKNISDNVCYIYSVNMNTEYFQYKDYSKFIDRNMSFTKKSLKYIASLILKAKKDVILYKKIVDTSGTKGIVGFRNKRMIG